MFLIVQSLFVIGAISVLFLASACSRKIEESEKISLPETYPLPIPAKSFPSNIDSLPFEQIVDPETLKTVTKLISPLSKKIQPKPIPVKKDTERVVDTIVIPVKPIPQNEKTQMEWKPKKSRGHLSEVISFRLKTIDPEDSLIQVRIRMDSLWENVELTKVNRVPGQKLVLYRSRSFDKVGTRWSVACVTTSDKRESCDSTAVEIYNASPEVLNDSAIRAIPGVPVLILGRARDVDGQIVKWEWDLDGDGKFEIVLSQEENIRYTFARTGKFILTLRATNAEGLVAYGRRNALVKKSW